MPVRMIDSIIVPGHPDHADLVAIRDGLIRAGGGLGDLQAKFPRLVRDSIDFVLDSVRTARTQIHELDNVEKTFVGLKIEHFIRDLLDVPKGLRDLVIEGRDVDIKNTLDNSWMIPPETYRKEDPCLVINSKEIDRTCWMGVMLARTNYLNAPNRDGKRGVSADAVANVLWIVEGASYPISIWEPFDMAQFRILRDSIAGGSKRMAEFFRQNLGKPVERSVIQALLFDQYDYMKRVRGNGGARDALRTEGIAVLSGIYGNSILKTLGHPVLQSNEIIAIAPANERERSVLLGLGIIDG